VYLVAVLLVLQLYKQNTVSCGGKCISAANMGGKQAGSVSL
jgi:hypothetical protein